jgi:hypothetical protein
MNSEQSKLNEFISTDKFSDEIWKSRGLNSSGIEMSNRLNIFFNQCANDLLKSKKENYKDCLNAHLKQIDSFDYDTEEKEFITDYFFELSEICSINFKEDLMKWMYGKEISELLKSKKSTTGEIISNSCTNCNGALNTEIIERQKGIPDFAYTVIKCKDCFELNMIELGPEIKQFSFGNYMVEIQLPKSEYSREQALEKLKQLKSEK